MTHTRPPEPVDEVAGTTLRTHIERWRLLGRRHRVGAMAVVGIVCLLLGVLIGRATGPDPDARARTAVEDEVLPLMLDADAIWTAGVGDAPPVGEALMAMRRDDDLAPVEQHYERWLEAYESALVRMAGLDMQPQARPVQRQFMAAVTLSRDAVEVLALAAATEDRSVRRDLTTEAARLRQRSEQLTQSALASTSDLTGGRTDVSPLPSITDFEAGRE